MTEPAASAQPNDQPIGTRRVLHPSRGRWISVAVIAALFILIGVFLIATRGSWIGWLSVIFFGFVFAIALAQMAGRGTQLILHADTSNLRTSAATRPNGGTKCATSPSPAKATTP